jgi:hypothetical protein
MARTMAASCNPETAEARSASADTGPKSRTEENIPGRFNHGRFQRIVGPWAEKRILKATLITTMKHARYT